MNGEAFVKDLLKRGRCSFTLPEACERLGKQGPALNLTLQRLKKAGWIAPISRGFYVALDVQHQTASMLDPVWFVDDWARHMRMAYYVGGLSAAELHGAAHQPHIPHIGRRILERCNALPESYLGAFAAFRLRAISRVQRVRSAKIVRRFLIPRATRAAC